MNMGQNFEAIPTESCNFAKAILNLSILMTFNVCRIPFVGYGIATSYKIGVTMLIEAMISLCVG